MVVYLQDISKLGDLQLMTLFLIHGEGDEEDDVSLFCVLKILFNPFPWIAPGDYSIV